MNSRRYVLLAIGLVIICGIVATAAYDFDNWVTSHDDVWLGLHRVQFYGRTYDAVDDESTWYYLVSSASAPAISHWVLELCAEHVVADAGPGSYAVGPDSKHTGIYGIKWESGFDDGETRQCWVTLEGNWEVEKVDVGIKAGGNIYTSEIFGPSCSPPPEISVAVYGLTDLTVTQPLIGTWSSLPDGFTQSLGGLTVSVTATGTVSYTASVWYSVSPDPSPAFTDDPLLFEDPDSPGTWTMIPSALAPPETLPGLSSGTQSKTYPVVVDLTKLGDRKAGETFTFTVHVNVVVTGSGL